MAWEPGGWVLRPAPALTGSVTLGQVPPLPELQLPPLQLAQLDDMACKGPCTPTVLIKDCTKASLPEVSPEPLDESEHI